MPTIISGVSSLLSRKRVASKLTQVGDNLINRGTDFLYNKLGPQHGQLAKEVLAPGVQAFRDQLNKVGAFVDQKRYPGNMMISGQRNDAGKQYIDEQRDQMSRLQTPAHQFMSQKEKAYHQKTGGPVTQGRDGVLPRVPIANPERPVGDTTDPGASTNQDVSMTDASMQAQETQGRLQQQQSARRASGAMPQVQFFG